MTITKIGTVAERIAGAMRGAGFRIADPPHLAHIGGLISRP
jgi:hypothetical protein